MIALLSTLLFAGTLPKDVELPIRIGTAISVSEISHINEADATFNATVDVMLRWQDPSLAFDRLQAGTDRQVFIREAADNKRAEIWDPHIDIVNLDPDSAKRDVSLRIYANGQVEYTQRIQGVFAMPVDLGRFPFDSQNLVIELASPDHNAREVQLVHAQSDADLSSITQSIHLSEWTLSPKLDFDSDHVRGLDGMIHSQMTAAVQVSRVAKAYVASLFAPLAVILLLPVLCIWVRTDIHERINWVITAVFSLIALNFSVSISYPALGIDSMFMRLFWYGYVAQGAALTLIMILFNEGALAAWLGRDLLEEALDYLSWSMPLVIALAFGDVILALAT